MSQMTRILKKTASGLRIVIAKLIRGKKHKHKAMDGPIGPNPECACFPHGGMNDGFWVQFDGAPVLMSGLPATGGPWIPAMFPNGQTVWINGGGL